MERIGLVADKMAKGNLFMYNLFVIAISMLASLLLFLMSSLVVFTGLFIVIYALHGGWPNDVNSQEFNIVKLSLVALTVLVGVFNLVAVLRNVKLNKREI